LVEDVDTLIQRALICNSKLFSSLNLLLDFVLELSHVKHKLVNFAAPHCQLFSFKIVLERNLPLFNLFSSVMMADRSQVSEAHFHFHSVNVVPCVSGDSLLFLSSLEPCLPSFQVSLVVPHSSFHFKEPLNAAVILRLESFKLSHLLLLLFNSLFEIIDVSLLFVKVDLVVILILNTVVLLQVLVLFEHCLVEFKEKLVVGGFELLDVPVVV